MDTIRASAWSLTINNPTATDEEEINLARQKGWKVEGQLERGTSGTAHYQLLVKTPQTRLSTLKKHFKRGHIEPARNVAALERYVKKEDTREGELKTQQDKYPSLQTTWDMFTEWITHTHKGRHNDWSKDEWLINFDKFVAIYIEEGYVLETIAVNPQVRSSVKQFGINIYHRSLRRQTDRQTDDTESVLTDTTHTDTDVTGTTASVQDAIEELQANIDAALNILP